MNSKTGNIVNHARILRYNIFPIAVVMPSGLYACGIPKNAKWKMSRILLNPLVDISVGSKRDVSVLMLWMVEYPGILQGLKAYFMLL